MNFVLIQTDQQRFDSLGCCGNRIVRTPALDALASRGVVFDYAFTPIPLCAPARASLMTGKRPEKHGILFNEESGTVGGRDFNGWHVFLPELLRSRGYRCFQAGKWHIGTDIKPSDRGFDGVFYPGYGYPDSHPHYLEYLRSMKTKFELTDIAYSRRPDGSAKYALSAVQKGPEKASVPYYITTQAISEIRQANLAGEQFFVQLDFWGPHAPYILPERYARMYDPASIPPWPNLDDDLSGKPEIQRFYREYWGIEKFTWDDWSRLAAMLYGSVTQIDDQVARVIKTLNELGIADDTAVIFVADHGGMAGSHGLEDKGPYLYDEICRVPMIASVPGGASGARSEALVYNADLMPTILDLVGCYIPVELDFVSLAPILMGTGRSARDPHEPAYVTFHGHQTPCEQRMVRTREAKYVFNAAASDELYDLVSDPYEMRNVAGKPECHGLLREMRLLMRARLIETRDTMLTFFEGSRVPDTGADSPVGLSSTGRIEWR